MWYDFGQLSTYVLYDILKLRQDIFIVEQKVYYEDIDNIDLHSKHLIGTINGEIIATLRLLPVDLFAKGYLSFGRVVVKKEFRRNKIGHLMMHNLLNYLKQNDIPHPIKISAQHYLVKFYRYYGFEVIGKPYIEDLVKHIAMIKEKCNGR
jgi:ElaA protein